MAQNKTAFARLDWRVFTLSGPDRKDFLHGLVTNDVKGLKPGAELPCCLLTPKGMLQALFWVYEIEDALWLVVPPEGAGNLEKALRKLLPLSESKLENLSSRWAVYWVGADRAPALARSLPFSALGKPGCLALVEPAARREFEGALGPALDAAALERLRLDRALPRFGTDVDDSTIPLEAGLDWTISYTKGCYMGQETISRIHHLGHVNRALVRLRFAGQAPAAGTAVTAKGHEAGRITSAAGEVALAMVRAEAAVRDAVVEAGGLKATVQP